MKNQNIKHKILELTFLQGAPKKAKIDPVDIPFEWLKSSID